MSEYTIGYLWGLLTGVGAGVVITILSLITLYIICNKTDDKEEDEYECDGICETCTTCDHGLHIR